MPFKQDSLYLSVKQLMLGSLLLTAVSPVLAAKPVWDCRVSTDGTSWDCYRDGALVVQPMPQTSPVPQKTMESAEQAETVSVPDQPVITPVTEPAAAAMTPIVASDEDKQKAAAESPKVVETDKTQTVEKEPVTATDVVGEEPASVADDSTEAVAESSESTDSPSEEVFTKPVEIDESARQAVDVKTEQPAAETVEEEQTAPAVTSEPQQAESQAQEVVEQKPVTEPKAEPEPLVAEQEPPAFCPPPGRHIPRQATSSDALTHVTADDANIDQQTDVAHFQGNVELQRGDQTVLSDQMQYDNKSADLEASGNLKYRRPNLQFTGESAKINLDTETGSVSDVLYRLPVSDARGSASEMRLTGKGVTQYSDLTYTTCPPGNRDWIFNAKELELDQNTGVGTAEDLKLTFKDVPILYLPKATFPIDDRRKSGFLVPSIGASDNTGFDVSAPYYLNLAPNYDATIVPRIMTDRGLMLGGEFRYLDQKHSTVVSGEILPDDNESNVDDPRGSAALLHTTRFTDRLSANLNLNYVSDRDYFEDFGSGLNITSERHLKRTASMTYNGDHFSLSGLVQNYQTIEKGIAAADRPYERLPQISFEGEIPVGDSNFTAHLDAQYTSFEHDANVEGQRFDIRPAISYDWRRSWFFVTPRLSYRFTDYELDGQAVGQPDSIDRNIGTFSLDSGLIFERETNWFGVKSTQTLEPRLFYLYTPEENQDDIPVFDSAEYDISYANLFRENRFSGADRVGDANKLTLAVTTRVFSDSDFRELFSASVGQTIHFEDEEVQLPGVADFTEDTSEFIALVSAELTPEWSAGAGLQWNPHADSEVEKSAFKLVYNGDNKRLLSVRYQRNQPENLEYAEASAHWPVAFNTRLIGHVNYSFQEDYAVETLAGIEHGSSCCWRVRAIVRDYQVDVDDESNLSFMLQLELTGFGRLGDDIDSFLEDTLVGYAKHD